LLPAFARYLNLLSALGRCGGWLGRGQGGRTVDGWDFAWDRAGSVAWDRAGSVACAGIPFGRGEGSWKRGGTRHDVGTVQGQTAHIGAGIDHCFALKLSLFGGGKTVLVGVFKGQELQGSTSWDKHPEGSWSREFDQGERAGRRACALFGRPSLLGWRHKDANAKGAASGLAGQQSVEGHGLGVLGQLFLAEGGVVLPGVCDFNSGTRSAGGSSFLGRTPCILQV
jgi:hypothetical protein